MAKTNLNFKLLCHFTNKLQGKRLSPKAKYGKAPFSPLEQRHLHVQWS